MSNSDSRMFGHCDKRKTVSDSYPHPSLTLAGVLVIVVIRVLGQPRVLNRVTRIVVFFRAAR
jgi:hypothetical protein